MILIKVIKMSKEIAKTEQRPSRMARFSPDQIAAARIDEASDLPSLVDTKAAPVPLSVEYWSPENEGDSKRGWILGIEVLQVPDMETGEIKDMESVLFVEEGPDGKKSRYYNAGKVLVANVKDAINRGEIIPASILTPVQITYLGQKKNRSNSRLSKRFEILPLIVSQQ
jgi:hypothetical protein